MDRRVLALVASMSLSFTPASPQDRWADAEQAIVRLHPAAFAQLPAEISGALEERGCTIPQPADVTGPLNVVAGEFLAPGSISWAILCSVDGVSSILVFDAEARRVAELNPVPDRDYLQGLGGGEIGFSRRVTGIAPERILGRYRAEGGAPEDRPELTHDGIEDAFLGKASSVRYYTDGRWIDLPGAD